MGERPSSNQGIIMNGNARIDAGNLAVGNHARIDVASDLGRLKDNIRALPDSVASEKADLEKHRAAIETEASKPTPSRSKLEISAKGLLAAAKSVALITPEILTTAERVASWVAKLI